MTKTELTPGSWPSPISPAALATASLRLGEVLARPRCLYWWEGRPDEGGRGVVVRRDDDGTVADVTPADHDVRTRVHEYGGAAWTVVGDDVVYVELTSQQIHRATAGAGGPVGRRITHAPTSRFADLTPHPDGRHLLAVREDHDPEADEPVNDLVAVDLDSGAIRRLFGGTDFVSSPRPSAGGDQVAFVTWSHPQMPWDHTELRVLDWETGTTRTLIEGEAVQQPVWSAGRLLAVTDRSGWWLPHEVDLDSGAATALVDAEVDAGLPPWVFGSTTLVDHDGRLAVMWQADGTSHVGWLDGGRLVEIVTDLIDIGSIAVDERGRIVAAAATATHPRGIVRVDPAGEVEVITRPASPLDPAAASPARHISFPSGDRTAHALLYLPNSATHVAPAGELPPLLVLSHGGPTGAARPGFDLAIQFWTTRGFAVVDVNYGGSTGYGRTYRNLLRDRWGIVDVEDCIAAARHLVDTGAVDGDRLAIKGGSAGGYTTLAALAFHDVFDAGASRYGIADLEILARDTHKFESRYLDGFIGPYPEARDIYVERSPIHAVERISAPLIVLQGDEDAVVPPNQAEAIVAAVAARGLPHAYLLFEGEQHGFRDGANIARAVEAEYVFFCRVFGIEPSGDPAPLEIVGLD